MEYLQIHDVPEVTYVNKALLRRLGSKRALIASVIETVGEGATGRPVLISGQVWQDTLTLTWRTVRRHLAAMQADGLIHINAPGESADVYPSGGLSALYAYALDPVSIRAELVLDAARWASPNGPGEYFDEL